jgi:hypothetical protein
MLESKAGRWLDILIPPLSLGVTWKLLLPLFFLRKKRKEKEGRRGDEMRRNLMGNQSRKERIAHEKDSREKRTMIRDALFLFPSPPACCLSSHLTCN